MLVAIASACIANHLIITNQTKTLFQILCIPFKLQTTGIKHALALYGCAMTEKTLYGCATAK